MTDVFLQLINMSLSASWLVLAVVVARLLLKKAPKWGNLVLWGLVGLRLALPFSIESSLSLIPSSQTFHPEILFQQAPAIQSGIPAVNDTVNPIIAETFAPEVGASANPLQIWFFAAAIIWAVGVAAMLLYTCASFARLHRSVRTAILLQDNIFQCETVATPFVLGLLHPRIYLPFHISQEAMAYVIAHEQTHIKRLDHILKPVAFVLLCLHWFNPLIWAAYILFCRDMELTCDEQVIKRLEPQQRADYSQVLLTFSMPRNRLSACPIAFGEIGVKQRVKNILNYKKPALWLTITAVATSILLTGCFLTDPKEEISVGPDIESANTSPTQVLPDRQENTVNTPDAVCTDTDCTDASHGHKIGSTVTLDLNTETVSELACTDAHCTDTSHGHEIAGKDTFSSEAAVGYELACADINCTDPSHGHESIVLEKATVGQEAPYPAESSGSSHHSEKAHSNHHP